MPSSTLEKGSESDARPLLGRTSTHRATGHCRALSFPPHPSLTAPSVPTGHRGAGSGRPSSDTCSSSAESCGRGGQHQPGPPSARAAGARSSPRAPPRPALGKLPHSRPAAPRPAVRADPRAPRPPPWRPRAPRGPGRAPRLHDAAGRPAGTRSLRLIRRNIATQGAARPAAEASHPRVPSLRPRPDTQSQTCGLSRPGAQLRAGKEAGRPGLPRAAQLPAMHREDREDQAAATVQRKSFARHQRNGGLGGVRGPEEGARQGGRAAAGAPIGPGSRPSAQVPALSRGAPPSLVRRRPEGSGTLPLAPSAPPAPRPAPACPEHTDP